MTVQVCDALCGAGKTSAAAQGRTNHPEIVSAGAPHAVLIVLQRGPELSGQIFSVSCGVFL